MKVYTLLKRGTNHKDFCEDYQIIVPINERFEIFGVFDGCSSGIDSHFASSLTGKIIKSEALKLIINKSGNISKTVKLLFLNSFKEILEIKKRIGLEINELLSTVILYLHDKLSNTGEIIVSGDGLISINNKQIIIDKDNSPNYFIYKGNIKNPDFEKIYISEIETFTVNNAKDITISTDGILSFIKQSIPKNTIDEKIDPIKYLINNISMRNNSSMLKKKYNILKNQCGFINYDDVSMIRIII